MKKKNKLINKIIFVFILFLSASSSFAQTLVLKNKKLIQGEILEYNKDSLIIMDERQSKIESVLKSQILFIAYHSFTEALMEKIESEISENNAGFEVGRGILILPDGTIKKGKVSQWTKNYTLIDSGETIEEISHSDAYGIYFVQDKSYYLKRIPLEPEINLIKKDKSQLKGKLKLINKDSFFIKSEKSELLIFKNEILWIYFGPENKTYKQKTEKEFSNSAQSLTGKAIIVFKNETDQIVSLNGFNGFNVSYNFEGIPSSSPVESIYGIYFGASVESNKVNLPEEQKKSTDAFQDKTSYQKKESKKQILNGKRERGKPQSCFISNCSQVFFL